MMKYFLFFISIVLITGCGVETVTPKVIYLHDSTSVKIETIETIDTIYSVDTITKNDTVINDTTIFITKYKTIVKTEQISKVNPVNKQNEQKIWNLEVENLDYLLINEKQEDKVKNLIIAIVCISSLLLIILILILVRIFNPRT